jgi:predicted nucleic acid-binding protein
MSKKTNEKKKVNIKLSSNQSYFVDEIDTFMHIQKTYADLLRSVKNEIERENIVRILNKINEAFENIFVASMDGSGDDW